MPTLRTLIERGSCRHGNKVFLVEAATGRTLTYDRLAAEARRVAEALARSGMRPGDRVAGMLGNTMRAVQLMLGAWSGGFTIVPVAADTPPAGLDSICESAQIDVLCAPREAAVRLRPTRIIERVVLDEALDEPRDARPARVQAPRGADDALLMHTSGTTGRRKAARLSHHNLLAGAINTARAHGLGPGDRGLCVLPLHHINAVVVTVLAPLLTGGSVVLAPQFDSAGFWRLIAEHRCTWFSVVPAQLGAALGAAEIDPSAAAAAAGCLRFGRTASAPLPPALHQRFESRFGLPIVETMGLTETAATVFANPLPPRERKPGSVGLPVGVRVRIAPEAGDAAGPGVPGAIEVRGRCVMPGYFDDEEATHTVVSADGWLRTGDAGYRDGDGYVYVTGRTMEMINRGGERIAPREIDDVMTACAGVRQAVCFGVPHPTLGEDLAVAIVPEPGAAIGEAGLLRHAARHLHPAKVPSRVFIVDTVPCGPSGKPQRLRLREHFAIPDAEPYEAPRGEVERLIAAAFSEVLGRDRVGRRDHLFALGGDSLAAVRIAARLSDVFGMAVPASAVVSSPTVRDLANLIGLE
jgi:long-chain acyl-CoA synthetase